MLFSLLPGVLGAPTVAKASLLSAIIGENVSASTVVEDTQSKDNSQKMGLLEAIFSPIIALADDSKEDDKKAEKEGEIAEDADVLIADNALVPATGPLGVSDGTEDPELIFEDFEEEISIYVVRKGDSLATIAKMFDVTVDTILSANDIKKGDKPKEGDVLFILPFSGVEHKVAKGETLKGIANKYKVPVEDVVLYNHLEGTKIVVGDSLIIPGGGLLEEKSPTKSTGNIAKGGSTSNNFVNTSGYFVNPVPAGGHWVRGLSRTHKGVDIGAPTGTPIRAAASGRVRVAKTGWNGGYGNVVFIEHPNGTQTVYAHMSRLGTSTGAQVAQGEVIGYVGSTGRSSGPHLHYEVRGGKNNLAR